MAGLTQARKTCDTGFYFPPVNMTPYAGWELHFLPWTHALLQVISNRPTVENKKNKECIYVDVWKEMEIYITIFYDFKQK